MRKKRNSISGTFLTFLSTSFFLEKGEPIEKADRRHSSFPSTTWVVSRRVIQDGIWREVSIAIILYGRWLPLTRLLLLTPGVTSTRKHLLVAEAMVGNARYGFCSFNLHMGMISLSPTWSNTKLYGIQMNHIGSHKTPDSKYYLPSIKQMFVSKLQSPLIGWHCAA